MRGRDGGQVLLRSILAERAAPGRARRGGSREGRRSRPLYPRVHIGFVVHAEVGDVMAALEHPGEGPETDVQSRAIPAECEHFDAVELALLSERGLNAGRHRRRVLEERVHPGNAPGGLGMRRAEHLQAPRRVGSDTSRPCSLHDYADGGCLGATSAGAMPRQEASARVIAELGSGHISSPPADRRASRRRTRVPPPPRASASHRWCQK